MSSSVLDSSQVSKRSTDFRAYVVWTDAAGKKQAQGCATKGEALCLLHEKLDEGMAPAKMLTAQRLIAGAVQR